MCVSTIIGLPEEWKVFSKTHSVFLEGLTKLIVTVNKVFVRTFNSRTPADGVVFHLGRLCVEDFMEILVLCGNGYGIGGLKLLRGFYERVVTMAYISKSPSEAEAFLAYHPVHVGRALHHAKAVVDVTKIRPRSEIEDMERQFGAVKDKYQEVLCEKCETTRTRFSWSPLDIASMAKKVGLDGFYLTCYYDPILHGHATPSSILLRLVAKVDGSADAMFDEAAQREKVDTVLNQAHALMLYTLSVQNEFFNLGFDVELRGRLDDFTACWEHVPLIMRTIF